MLSFWIIEPDHVVSMVLLAMIQGWPRGAIGAYERGAFGTLKRFLAAWVPGRLGTAIGD